MPHRWSDSEAEGKDEMGLLVYQSRLVGADTSLVVWGGGNTSIKTTEKDFRGREVGAMTVKGSGSDLKTIEPKHFPSLDLEDVLLLFDRDAMSDDEMVSYLAQCMLDPKSPRPSIETLLHAFLPYHSVVHSHADAIVSLTNTRNFGELLKKVYGERAAIVEYLRPGFALSKLVGQRVRENPDVDGVILVNHGLFTWGNTTKEAYLKHLDLVDRAAEYAEEQAKGRTIFTPGEGRRISEKERRRLAAGLAPVVRGLVSRSQSTVLRYDDSPDVMEFVNSAEGAALSQVGPATPDHTLQTKIKPLWVEPGEPTRPDYLMEHMPRAVDRYVSYYKGWYQANTDGQHPMLDPHPRVILVRGVGMWSTGKDAKAALIAGDVYHHTISVMKAAQAVGHYASLSDKDAYDVEYWPMELYKLTLASPGGEFSSKVAMVTGGAHGIGKAVAERLAAEGAHVVVADIDVEGANEVAQSIVERQGVGRAMAVNMDVTNPEQVAEAFSRLRIAYGGLDVLVSNAGIAPVGAIHELSLEDWQKAMDINSTGHFLVARETVSLMRQQGIGGSMVFVGTKNVPSPGKDFGAYSASKAAEVQMARVLAIENGEVGIRVNVVNPDAVFQGSNLWSAEVKEMRARAHGISIDGLEEFYRQRNLLKRSVTAEDVAEAILFLAGPRSSKTTGTMLPVDAGLRDAFPR